MTDDTESPTVLIVEDEESLADLYALFLESTYTVLTAYDGTQALDRMNEDINVVLLDRRMPGLSGKEVLQAIRAEGYDCRIAMVTAVTPDTDIIDMGFDDYLTKPVDSADLHETVERLLALERYDNLMEEYYQLTSKKAVLEVERSDLDLQENEEFTRLSARLEELDTELQEKQESTAEFDIRSLIEQPGYRSSGD